MEDWIIHENSPLVLAMRDALADDATGSRPHGRRQRAHDLLANPQQLSQLCTACFWASMETEEGRAVRGTLAICSPQPSLPVRVLADPAPVGVAALISLLTASPRTPLAVHGGRAGLHIWGMLDTEPEGFVRLRIAGNGTLLASQSERVLALYHKGVMFKPKAADGPSLLLLMAETLGKRRLLELDSQTITQLIRLVTAMIRHGHGGALVVVEPDDSTWRKSVRFKFAFFDQKKSATEHPGVMSDALLQRIGELSLIDGAVVIDTELHLYGFGAKLELGKADPRVVALNAVSGDIHEGLSISELGGMRHQSAARFVSANHTAHVFVVSQDGRLSLFCWSKRHDSIALVQNLEHFLWEHAGG